MHTVAVIALDGVLAFDLSTPVELFGRVRLPNGQPAYRVLVCAATGEVSAGPFVMRVPWGLDKLAEADTIILPGLADISAPVPGEVLVALHQAAERGTRLASICVGAFTLAATGLLDGLRATTHWLAAHELARQYPNISVDPNVLFVDNGQFLTSAGAAAGLDLCLYLVRKDYGAAVAADAARYAVMPLERDGGQAQFIIHERPSLDGVSLEPLMRWIEGNIWRNLTHEELAVQAGMSLRTFSRHFREQTGTTPMQWVQRARLHQAQYLLETTDFSVEQIASRVGFGSTTTFRDNFRQFIGNSPQSYRRNFRYSQPQS